jgi:hypothetical protein
MIWISTICIRKDWCGFSVEKKKDEFRKIFVCLFTHVVEKENQLLDSVIIDHCHYHQVNYAEVLILMFD